MEKKIIIFDVCNTLYDSNTTFEFIAFVLAKRSGSQQFFFRLMTSRLSPLFYYYLLLGKFKRKDIIRDKAVHLLRGLSKGELDHLAEEFYHTYLSNKSIDKVMKLFYKAKENSNVWLFSNSIEPVIRVIADHLQVNYEASSLAYEGQPELFSGRILKDLKGIKQIVFKQNFGEAPLKMMCSDNKSDYPILKMAQHPYVVINKVSD